MDAPRLEFDWELGIFKGLNNLLRRVRPKRPSFHEDRVVFLAPHLPSLSIIAQLLAGMPIKTEAARDVGGIRQGWLLLPALIDLAPTPEENRQLYLVRTCMSACMYRLRPNTIPPQPYQRSLLSLQLAQQAFFKLCEEFPHFATLHTNAARIEFQSRPNPDFLSGREKLLEIARQQALQNFMSWNSSAFSSQLDNADGGTGRSRPILIWGEILGDDSGEGGADVPTESESTRANASSETMLRAIEDIKRVLLNPKEPEISVLSHTFEKVETADQYRGGARDTDGSDELNDHLEALEEVDFSEVMRGGDAVHSILRAPIDMHADTPDVATDILGEKGIPYDEWNFRAREYRRRWCMVYPTPVYSSDSGWALSAINRHGPTIGHLRRRLEIHRSRLRPLSRQLDGDDVDLDAVVMEKSDVLAGHGGSQRLYVRHVRRERDIATTVLLDISLSTDAWVDNLRVIDVAKESVLVLGEVAESLRDPLQVLAFASHTRNRCRVWTVRDWHDSWTLGRARLGSLAPQGYTRIGPALRHATAELNRIGARKRLLLLIGDGKPTDYDRYEGQYGIADIRQAVREATRTGIVCHALAVESQARHYLPAMFGAGAWHILSHARRLPEMLSMVYGRLTTG